MVGEYAECDDEGLYPIFPTLFDGRIEEIGIHEDGEGACAFEEWDVGVEAWYRIEFLNLEGWAVFFV